MLSVLHTSITVWHPPSAALWWKDARPRLERAGRELVVKCGELHYGRQALHKAHRTLHYIVYYPRVHRAGTYLSRYLGTLLGTKDRAITVHVLNWYGVRRVTTCRPAKGPCL